MGPLHNQQEKVQDEAPIGIVRAGSRRLKSLACSIGLSHWVSLIDKHNERHESLEAQRREEKYLRKQYKILEENEKQSKKNRKDPLERRSSSRISTSSRRSWTSHGSGESLLRRLSRRQSRGPEGYGPLPSPSDISDQIDNIPTVSRVYTTDSRPGLRTSEDLQSQPSGYFSYETRTRRNTTRRRRHTDPEMAPSFDELFIDRPSQMSATRSQSRPRPSASGRRPTLKREGDGGIGVAYGHQRSGSAHLRNGPRCYASVTDKNGQSTNINCQPLHRNGPFSLSTQTKNSGKSAHSSGTSSTQTSNQSAPVSERDLRCITTTYEPYVINENRSKGAESSTVAPNRHHMDQARANRLVQIHASTKLDRPILHSRRATQQHVKKPMTNSPAIDPATPPPPPPVDFPANLVPGHEKARSGSASTPKRPTTPHASTPTSRPRQYTINGSQRDRVTEPYTLAANAVPTTSYTPFRPPSPVVSLLPMGSPTTGNRQIPARPMTAPSQRVHRDKGADMGNFPIPLPVHSKSKKISAAQTNENITPTIRNNIPQPQRKLSGGVEPQMSNGVTTCSTSNQAVVSPWLSRERAQTMHAGEPSTPIQKSPVTQAPQVTTNYTATLPSPDFDQFDFQWHFLMESLASDIVDDDEGQEVRRPTALLPSLQSPSAQPMREQEHSRPVQEFQSPQAAQVEKSPQSVQGYYSHALQEQCLQSPQSLQSPQPAQVLQSPRFEQALSSEPIQGVQCAMQAQPYYPTQELQSPQSVEVLRFSQFEQTQSPEPMWERQYAVQEQSPQPVELLQFSPPIQTESPESIQEQPPQPVQTHRFQPVQEQSTRLMQELQSPQSVKEQQLSPSVQPQSPEPVQEQDYLVQEHSPQPVQIQEVHQIVHAQRPQLVQEQSTVQKQPPQSLRELQSPQSVKKLQYPESAQVQEISQSVQRQQSPQQIQAKESPESIQELMASQPVQEQDLPQPMQPQPSQSVQPLTPQSPQGSRPSDPVQLQSPQSVHAQSPRPETTQQPFQWAQEPWPLLPMQPQSPQSLQQLSPRSVQGPVQPLSPQSVQEQTPRSATTQQFFQLAQVSWPLPPTQPQSPQSVQILSPKSVHGPEPSQPVLSQSPESVQFPELSQPAQPQSPQSVRVVGSPQLATARHPSTLLAQGLWPLGPIPPLSPLLIQVADVTQAIQPQSPESVQSPAIPRTVLAQPLESPQARDFREADQLQSPHSVHAQEVLQPVLPQSPQLVQAVQIPQAVTMQQPAPSVQSPGLSQSVQPRSPQSALAQPVPQTVQLQSPHSVQAPDLFQPVQPLSPESCQGIGFVHAVQPQSPQSVQPQQISEPVQPQSPQPAQAAQPPSEPATLQQPPNLIQAELPKSAIIQQVQEPQPPPQKTQSSTPPPSSPSIARKSFNLPQLPIKQTQPPPPAPIQPVEPIDKTFIICCNCERYHDLPAAVLEIWLCGGTTHTPGTNTADDDSPLQDAEADQQNVSSPKPPMNQEIRCCWCSHDLNRDCCAGWSTVVSYRRPLQ